VFDSRCGVVENPDAELRTAFQGVDECAGPGDYRRALRFDGFAQ
jgi:hypothetical protein